MTTVGRPRPRHLHTKKPTMLAIATRSRSFVRRMATSTHTLADTAKALIPGSYLIDGEWAASPRPTASRTYAVENPATAAVITALASCGADETNRAIQAAAAAFKPWSTRPAKDRAAVLMRWYDECVKHRDEITEIMTLECGKPLAEARNEFDSGVESLRFFAGEATRVDGDFIPGDDSRDFLVMKQPLGTKFF